MSDYSKLKWGAFELENATRKNSDCGVFGQKCVIAFPKLAIHG